MKKTKITITGKMIEIKGNLSRHKIVQKVVNTFIKTEYRKKGKGITFQYPVENLPDGQLFIVRPGHKKNFDFKVDVTPNLGLGEGSHIQIAMDLRKKRQENPQKFGDVLNTITQIYDCSENDVDKISLTYPNLNKSFQTGTKVNILLKVLKWLFIMEDIVYWDTEGRTFLFNYLRYVSEETNDNRLKEALEKAKNPDRLKSFMKKCGIKWIPNKG